MNPAEGQHWTPSRELLAAFADGELDGLPHLVSLRGQIEAWLATHAEAAPDLDAQLELARLMAVTAAPEPGPAAWAKVSSQLLVHTRRPGRRWKVAGAIAGLVMASAAGIVVAFLVFGNSRAPAPPSERAPSQTATVPVPPVVRQAPPQARPVEVLEVVSADEVEIVRVAGSDTKSLIVGQVPLTNPIVLLEEHEVEVMLPAHNPARTEVRRGGGSPMVWTPLANEKDEDDNG
jgi:hypothetical protein